MPSAEAEFSAPALTDLAAMAVRASPARGARRTPLHPGRFLETRFLQPLGVTQGALARALGVSRRRVNEIVRGKRGVSQDTALKLAAHFGNEPEFWLRMQMAWDVHRIGKGKAG